MSADSLEDPVKFDDYDWHAGSLPDELPFEQGFVHIGVYLAWLLERGLLAVNDEILSYPPIASTLKAVQRREVTGSALNDVLDGKLMSDLMTAEGDAFTRYYYERYLGDYSVVMTRLYPTEYHAADSWDTYDRMRAVINAVYDAWIAAGRPPPMTASRSRPAGSIPKGALSRWAATIPEAALLMTLLGGIIGGVALTAIRPSYVPGWIPLAVGFVISTASFALLWLRSPD
jgi:hypothetical protein